MMVDTRDMPEEHRQTLMKFLKRAVVRARKDLVTIQSAKGKGSAVEIFKVAKARNISEINKVIRLLERKMPLTMDQIRLGETYHSYETDTFFHWLGNYHQVRVFKSLGDIG